MAMQRSETLSQVIRGVPDYRLVRHFGPSIDSAAAAGDGSTVSVER